MRAAPVPRMVSDRVDRRPQCELRRKDLQHAMRRTVRRRAQLVGVAASVLLDNRQAHAARRCCRSAPRAHRVRAARAAPTRNSRRRSIGACNSHRPANAASNEPGCVGNAKASACTNATCFAPGRSRAHASGSATASIADIRAATGAMNCVQYPVPQATSSTLRPANWVVIYRRSQSRSACRSGRGYTSS
jgi:hypothetical protein